MNHKAKLEDFDDYWMGAWFDQNGFWNRAAEVVESHFAPVKATIVSVAAGCAIVAATFVPATSWASDPLSTKVGPDVQQAKSAFTPAAKPAAGHTQAASVKSAEKFIDPVAEVSRLKSNIRLLLARMQEGDSSFFSEATIAAADRAVIGLERAEKSSGESKVRVG